VFLLFSHQRITLAQVSEVVPPMLLRAHRRSLVWFAEPTALRGRRSLVEGRLRRLHSARFHASHGAGAGQAAGSVAERAPHAFSAHTSPSHSPKPEPRSLCFRRRAALSRAHVEPVSQVHACVRVECRCFVPLLTLRSRCPYTPLPEPITNFSAALAAAEALHGVPPLWVRASPFVTVIDAAAICLFCFGGWGRRHRPRGTARESYRTHTSL
jgi:hypothetical protein